MRWLVEERYPDVEYGRIELDQLNTHGPAALYEAFPADQARTIAARVEFHYTPKHGGISRNPCLPNLGAGAIGRAGACATGNRLEFG